MKNGTMKSSIDNLEIKITESYPKKGIQIKGIVQIVHGMSEDRTRYENFMKYLNSQGYITIIHDHRGHGESVERKQELGYLYSGGMKGLIEDTHQLTLSIRNHHKDLPLYLLGHSMMGDLIVRCYLQKYDNDINGLIVCGLFYKDKHVKLKKFTVNLIRLFKGPYHRSPYIHYILFEKYNDFFKDAPSKNTWLSSDEKEVEEYDKNIDDGFIFTLQGFKQLYNLLETTYQKKKYKVKKPYLPILFLGGKEDPVVPSKEDFKKMMTFLKKIGYRQVTGKRYAKCRHQILFEKDKKRVYQDIVAWLDQEVEENSTELL